MKMKIKLVMMTLAVVGLLAGALTAYGSVGAQAQGGAEPVVSGAQLQLFAVAGDPDMAGPGQQLPPSGTIVPGSWSTLVRTEEGITVSVHTHGLAPGAYTNWWVIDEQQDNPMTDPNNMKDFEIARRATGAIVSPDGTGNFTAYLPAGEIAEADWVTILRNGDGVFDTPMTARVMVVVRWHGPVISDILFDQLETFGGGCSNVPQDPTSIKTADFVCFDPQRVFHEP